MARTAKQRAALRKAQLASARKRRGRGKGKLAAAHRRSRRNGRIAAGVGIAGVAAVALTAYASSNTGKRHLKAGKAANSYRKDRGTGIKRAVKHGRGVNRLAKVPSYGLHKMPLKKTIKRAPASKPKVSYGRTGVNHKRA